MNRRSFFAVLAGIAATPVAAAAANAAPAVETAPVEMQHHGTRPVYRGGHRPPRPPHHHRPSHHHRPPFRPHFRPRPPRCWYDRWGRRICR